MKGFRVWGRGHGKQSQQEAPSTAAATESKRVRLASNVPFLCHDHPGYVETLLGGGRLR